jgi:peptidyl-prolyl cis-trans isomerase A (cyclophilin A)
MRKTALPLLLTLAVAPACKKNEPPAAAEPVRTAAPAPAPAPDARAQASAQDTRPADPGAAAPAAEPAAPTAAASAPGDTDEVRPPTKDDLAGYVADLKGKGPLQAVFDTSHGKITCELFDKKAPMTVANFVGLARGKKAFRNPRTNAVEKRPFYDGLVFHRVIPNFMIQGGDPLGVGSGSPGYEFATEVDPSLRHDRPGILAMANRGPNTNGSQFYITEVPVAHLDGGYNVFGACKEVDVVKKIARVERGPNDRPLEPVVIKKLTIRR